MRRRQLPRRRSSSTRETLDLRAPYGIKNDELYFLTSVAWVEPQGDDLVFSTNPAVAVVGDDVVLQTT